MIRLVAASTALALVSELPVAAERHSRGTTFEGSCAGYDTAVLSPPLSWVPAPVDGQWHSRGVQDLVLS